MRELQRLAAFLRRSNICNPSFNLFEPSTEASLRLNPRYLAREMQLDFERLAIELFERLAAIGRNAFARDPSNRTPRGPSQPFLISAFWKSFVLAICILPL
jgi:hypothetical protein